MSQDSGSGGEYEQLARMVRMVLSSVRVSFTVAVNYTWCVSPGGNEGLRACDPTVICPMIKISTRRALF